MPTYLLRCERDHVFDRYLKLKDYDSPQTCECGAKAKRQICAPMLAPTFEDYESPIDGSPITSKRKRIEDLAKSECIPYEEGLIDYNTKRIKADELKLDRDLDKTVDSIYESMPLRDRENLDRDIKAGADIEYHRA